MKKHKYLVPANVELTNALVKAHAQGPQRRRPRWIDYEDKIPTKIPGLNRPAKPVTLPKLKLPEEAAE